MAETVGLVAGAVAFVDFTWKLASTAKSIHGSTTGATRLIAQYDKQLHEFKARNRQLLAELQERAKARSSAGEHSVPDTDGLDGSEQRRAGDGSFALTKPEQQLQSAVTECEQIADQLASLIETLTMRPNATSKKFEATRVATRTFKKSKTVEELQEDLLKVDSKVRESMKNLLGSDRHSELSRKLNAVRATLDLHVAQISGRFDESDALQREIIEACRQSNAGMQKDWEQAHAELKGFLSKLKRFQVVAEEQSQQARVLERLYFTDIQKRWDDVKNSHTETNKWLFNQERTTFKTWLANPKADKDKDEDIFSIIGLAATGKTTLMKLAVNHPDTIQGLQKWAGTSKLCLASFFFWNPGSPLQKSQEGLLRSLLYQILREYPSLASLLENQEQRGEGLEPHQAQWGQPFRSRRRFKELQSSLDCIFQHCASSTKFCFFIDGLDEFDGAIEGGATTSIDDNVATLVGLVRSFSKFSHVKICISSRPLTYVRHNLVSQSWRIDIKAFTTDDIAKYIRDELRQNEGFRRVEKQNRQSCADLMDQMAEEAKGVWLWVYLVTQDIKGAASSFEELESFRKIVEGLPKTLTEYFKRIVEGAPERNLKEAAKIFLIAINEVQPLPLYAFSLINTELSNEEYALNEPVAVMSEEHQVGTEQVWMSLLYNRCRDLLVIGDEAHPLFLRHPVNFLHRAARDYLRDNEQDSFKERVPGFLPAMSLCRIMLFLIKKQPNASENPHRLIGLVDELLYYAKEVEDDPSHASKAESPVAEILESANQANIKLTSSMKIKHWTNLRGDPPDTDLHHLDRYREAGECNFLALAIQARLTTYVTSYLRKHPKQQSKKGRPLLDYALRPYRLTPARLLYHTQRHRSKIDLKIVRALLEDGADPNQKVYVLKDRTVWGLFLIACHESKMVGQATAESVQTWYEACELLIDRGAQRRCLRKDEHQNLRDETVVLGDIFGEHRAKQLLDRMDQVARDRVARDRVARDKQRGFRMFWKRIWSRFRR